MKHAVITGISLIFAMTLTGVALQHVQLTHAAADSITINLSISGGAPTYRASGFIYGLSQDGSQPPASMQSNIKTQFLRAGGAQLNCPNGGWINNDFATRWNSVKGYYARARAIGAKLILLPHDLWGADAVCNVPSYPGDNGNWTPYTNFMSQVISSAQANGMTGSDVQWDIWNEPDLGAFFGNRPESQYLAMWQRGFQMIRAAIPNAVIVGPSTASTPNTGNSWWTTYLNFIKANNVIPNYLSWHDEGGNNDPVGDANNLNSMLSSLGISVAGYQVNEYGTSSEQNPGHSAWFIARFERANTDAARGNWGMGTGLYGGMGGLVTAGGQANSQWWIYKRYGDQTGVRTQVTPGSQIDATSFTDAGAKKAIAVIGNRGGVTGSVTVQYTGIPSYLVANGQTQALVEMMPSGSGAVTAPTVVSNSPVTVSNNTITITLNWTNAQNGYAITLTPPGGGPVQSQYEAENGTWGGGAAVATDHTGYTGTGFVAYLINQGAISSFSIAVASAGNHTVILRYSAGPNGPTTNRTMSLYVNGTKIKQISFTRTADWNTWATEAETLSLNAGSKLSPIRLMLVIQAISIRITS
jgi:Carbohydrate binding module (family 35)